jgi:hypothetical protein
MAKNAKLEKLSTFERDPRHQDHAKMNVCILRDAMAMQRHNDQKVLVAFMLKPSANGIN